MHLDATFFAILFCALYHASELLSYIPWIKANGVYQLLMQILKTLSSFGKPNQG